MAGRALLGAVTDLNRIYLEEGCLAVEQLGRGYAWLQRRYAGQPPAGGDVRSGYTPEKAWYVTGDGRFQFPSASQ